MNRSNKGAEDMNAATEAQTIQDTIDHLTGAKTSHRGDRYDIENNVRDIAKWVRKDLKTFGKGWKFSVTISRYSMGQSLTVDILECPMIVVDPKEGENVSIGDAGRKVLSVVTAMVERYNRSESDSHTDYSNHHFYAHVSFCCNMTERQELAKGFERNHNGELRKVEA